MAGNNSFLKTSQTSKTISQNAFENNFMEISMDNDDEDNIEYIEYNDEHDLNGYIVMDEDDLIEEVALSDNENVDDNQDQVGDEKPSIEENGNTNKDPQNSLNDDLYHCSTCDIDFHSVNDHLKEFHKNQSVIIDGMDTNEESNVTISMEKEATQNEEENSVPNVKEKSVINRDIIVKSEKQVDADDTESVECYTIDEILNQDISEVEYVYETTDDNRIDYLEDNQHEEMFFDVNGRPYTRKKVKVERSDAEKYQINIEVSDSDRKVVNKEQDELEDLGLNQFGVWFICPICNRKFSTERKLTNHCRMHHKFEELVKPKLKKVIEEQVLCDVCNTLFPSNKSYRLHARMHGPVKIKAIEELVGYEMKASMKDGKISNETFYCEICDKSYDVSFEDVHKQSHKVGETFDCSICNKKFVDQINLTMHMKAHQENPKQKPPTKAELTGIVSPYECAYCGRQFSRPHEKVKHERIHTGEKPYKCEICGKCFRVAYCLTLHLRTHTGARPYVCPHCNKRYKAYSGYNHHLMTHSDERPYKCPHCPKAFKTSVQLAGHKNSHTKPFNCPECNRPFASLYAVKGHMETHKKSGHTLKHRCTICGAIYARAFALKDHMKEQHEVNFIENEKELKKDMNITEVPFLNENETSPELILPDNVEEITIDEMDHFQTEEIVTDWLK